MSATLRAWASVSSAARSSARRFSAIAIRSASVARSRSSITRVTAIVPMTISASAAIALTVTGTRCLRTNRVSFSLVE